MSDAGHAPLDLARMRRVAVIQEAQGSLCDAEFTRNLCDEVERLRALNAVLAEKLAACSECLTRAAERDYTRRNTSYRQGQEDMRKRVRGRCGWSLLTPTDVGELAICDLPGEKGDSK